MPIPAVSRAEPAAVAPHSRKHRRSGPARPADTAFRRFLRSDIRCGGAEIGAWRMIWRIINRLSRAAITTDVIAGLDPAIHHLRNRFDEVDGYAGQAAYDRLKKREECRP